jgi:uncharacterized protein YdaT
MPWTKKDYPVSMKNLPEAVRNKAIEMANAILAEGKMEEGIAIATAISRAKDWAAEHNKKTEDPEKSRITDVKEHGKDRVVTPHENEWAIKIEGRNTVEKVFRTKQEAVKQARKEVKKINGSLTIQKKTGKIEKRISFNPKNTGRKRSAKKRTARA